MGIDVTTYDCARSNSKGHSLDDVLDLKVEKQINNCRARDVSLIACTSLTYNTFSERRWHHVRARALVNSSQIRWWRGSVNISLSPFA